jgi:hypothetical protein
MKYNSNAPRVGVDLVKKLKKKTEAVIDLSAVLILAHVFLIIFNVLL